MEAIKLMEELEQRQNNGEALTKKAFCEEKGITPDALQKAYKAEIKKLGAVPSAVGENPTHWEANPSWRLGKIPYTIQVAKGRYFKCKAGERCKILPYMDIEVLKAEQKAGHIILLTEKQ